MELQCQLRRAIELLVDGVANRVGIERAHQFANELQLATAAFKVGDFFRFLDGIQQLGGQVKPRHQIGPQREQRLAECLLFIGLGLEHGFARWADFFKRDFFGFDETPV